MNDYVMDVRMKDKYKLVSKKYEDMRKQVEDSIAELEKYHNLR